MVSLNVIASICSDNVILIITNESKMFEPSEYWSKMWHSLLSKIRNNDLVPTSFQSQHEPQIQDAFIALGLGLEKVFEGVIYIPLRGGSADWEWENNDDMRNYAR